MRTCQPHLSISWNFPPPLSSLIYSISFGHTQPTSQWSLYKITAADTNRPARDSVGATLLQPDCTRFQGFCSGWERIITPYQTLIAPKIPFPLWHAIWLQSGGRHHICSGNYQWNVLSWEQRFCSQLTTGQENLRLMEKKRSWNPIQQSGCKQLPVFKGWKQKSRWPRYPEKFNVILARMSHGLTWHQTCNLAHAFNKSTYKIKPIQKGAVCPREVWAPYSWSTTKGHVFHI